MTLEQANKIAEAIASHANRPQPWRTYGTMPTVEEMAAIIVEECEPLPIDYCHECEKAFMEYMAPMVSPTAQ